MGDERNDLRQFCLRLAQLHREAGGPSVASLARNPSIPLRKSQIYAVLNGSLRTAPSWEFVREFVLLCAAASRRLGRRLTLSTDLEVWRVEHEFAVRAGEQERRQPPPATEESTETESKLLDAGLYVWAKADFQAGQSAGSDHRVRSIEPDERVDVSVLRQGRLPGLRAEFEDLTTAFEHWFGVEKSGSDPDRTPVLWIVGDPGPHRSKALLACLSHAGRFHPLLCDAGGDPGLISRAYEVLAKPRSTTRPTLIAVDLEGDLAAAMWSTVKNTIAQARKLSAPGVPLVVAGTAQQGQQAFDHLRGLIEMTTVDTRGWAHQRPESALGMDSMASAGLPSEHTFNRGLPITARRLFGRTAELAALTKAWASEQTRVVAIVASGGTGKSAVVNSWLAGMRQADYIGAERVLAWSFYSQGTRDNLVSADPFINFALNWIGDESAVTLNPWAKGARLAELIKKYRFLLILDGMEPLQYPLSAPDIGGRLTDDSMRSLLEELVKPDWEGLCVITTRVPLSDMVSELDPEGPATVLQQNLDNLDDRAAADLLRYLIRTDASFAELQSVVREVEGHALAITLMGNYLRDVHQGDLAGRFDLEELAFDVREGGHARRIMSSYVRWLEQYDRAGELTILAMIGLFDRPATPDAMGALICDPALWPEARRLGGVGTDEWNRCVDALRTMGLLNQKVPDWPGTLDAHPLVREHFRDLVLTASPEIWLGANRTLYAYYRDLAEPEPSSSEEMTMLYAAVTHGCAAGLYQEVFDLVLLKRIWRDRRTSYSTRLLGMTGSDLVALSGYFEHRRWTQLKSGLLSDRARVLILTNAGVRLRQLGRLVEARSCFAAVVSEIDLIEPSLEDCEDASYAAAQHCELLVIAGMLAASPENALATGRNAIEYADRGADPYFRMHSRSSLADTHFLLGDFEAARMLFDEARAIDAEFKPLPPFLYSQSLFRHGYFLIETGRGQELIDASADPAWGTNGQDSSLLSRAIRQLVVGAAHRAQIEAGDTSAATKAKARRLLDEAVTLLKAAGYADYVVRGLVERSHFWRVRHQTEDYARALADLAKADAEARRGRMTLLQTDVLLERTACHLAFLPAMSSLEREKAKETIEAALAEAEAVVNDIGYGRRRGFLDRLVESAIAMGIRA